MHWQLRDDKLSRGEQGPCSAGTARKAAAICARCVGGIERVTERQRDSEYPREPTHTDTHTHRHTQHTATSTFTTAATEATTNKAAADACHWHHLYCHRCHWRPCEHENRSQSQRDSRNNTVIGIGIGIGIGICICIGIEIEIEIWIWVVSHGSTLECVKTPPRHLQQQGL